MATDTIEAWNGYIEAVRSHMLQDVQTRSSLVRLGERQESAEKVRSGEPIVFPSGRTPQKVQGGLIHDWIGVVFVENAKIDDILATVRDYAHYSEFYTPAVANSKLLRRSGTKDWFSLLLVNKNLLSTTALESDYECSYYRIDDHRWYSISDATRIREIEEYGTPEQRTVAQNEGSGMLWRLSSVTLFEERDGGVFIQMEAIALSRDIPPSLRWVVTPIVRRISKNSLLTSLQQTNKAVCSRRQISAQLTSERNTTLPSGSTNATSLFPASFPSFIH